MSMEAIAEERGFVPDLTEVDSARPGEPEWLALRRRAAREQFEEIGFPTSKDEEWRYTRVGPILDTPWRFDREAPGPAVRIEGEARGVRVMRLNEALEKEPELLRAHLGQIAGEEANAFAALNQALSERAVIVVIERGAVVGDPIEIVHDSLDSQGPAVVAHSRCLILAGEGSEATVVERYEGEGASFRNAMTEIALGEGSVLSHYKLQQESTSAFHVQTIAIRQGRASRFVSHNVALGGALARTDIRVELAAEGSECELNGLFLGAGTQHLDTHTTIDHAMPHCVSRELYKGILDGKARGVFHGKIIVRPHAQKTDAMQTNKNLLLSREALVNSTPALEIFADDVKCRHGSTIGQLDDDALFYLRSRGLGEREARALLTYAFAADVAGRIRVPSVRTAVEAALGLRLAGARTKEETP
jgi:Fe-S cluster assembly protein SufD